MHSNTALAPDSDLRARVRALGFSPGQLDETLRYVRDRAPIIIHIRTSVLRLILDKNDSHYRNQHETGQSMGTLNSDMRTSWEVLLFGPSYFSAPAHLKPKYGVLNTTSDPRGVTGCHHYGPHILILSPSVRARTTFTPSDSARLAANPRELAGKIATCADYAHVLSAYCDKELASIMRVASGGGAEELGGAPSTATNDTYKEAQIHGEIDLRKHVDALVLNLGAAGDAGVARGSVRAVGEAFAERFGCSLLVFDGGEASTAGGGVGRSASSCRDAPPSACLRGWRCAACTIHNAEGASNCGTCDTPRGMSGGGGGAETTWECRCTLRNGEFAVACAACGQGRGGSQPLEGGGGEGAAAATFTCTSCTLVNSGEQASCACCGAARKPQSAAERYLGLSIK